jgi:hypothetical protein
MQLTEYQVKPKKRARTNVPESIDLSGDPASPPRVPTPPTQLQTIYDVDLGTNVPLDMPSISSPSTSTVALPSVSSGPSTPTAASTSASNNAASPVAAGTTAYPVTTPPTKPLLLDPYFSGSSDVEVDPSIPDPWADIQPTFTF